MNITVLVKPVPYKSIVDIDGNVVRNKIKNIINKDDKYAIEEALRIKEKIGGKVTSLSMTIKSNIKVLKDVLSYGVDDAILLNDNTFAGSDTNATAYILSQAIKKIKSDLIICGRVSSDSATSQVGIGVAAKLNIPFLYNVSEIINIDDKRIICKVINGDKYETIESTIPCLIVVNDSINIPRIPTVNNRLIAEKKEITLWDKESIDTDNNKCGFSGSCTNVIRLTPLNSNKNTILLEGTIEEKVDKVIEIIKANNNSNALFDSFEIEEKNNLEYWIYDNDFSSTCNLIAKCYKLARKTKAKIVIISFNKINKELFKYGANKLININIKSNDYITKSLAFKEIINKRKPNILLFNKTNEGKIISAYLSAKLDLGLSADCIKLELDENNRLIQIRSAYGGTMLASIVDKDCSTQMATVIPNNDRLIYNENNIGEIEVIDNDIVNNEIKVLKIDTFDNSYLNKDIIYCCGMGAVKELNSLKEIAVLTNASLGITRDVCDRDYLDTNYLIGQSGKITNSKVYIAFGVSGAIEHIVGVNSDIIISVNTDINAPIYKISDYYINEDANIFITMLLNKLKENKYE